MAIKVAVLRKFSLLGDDCAGGTVEYLFFRNLCQPSCVPIVRLNSVAKSRIEYFSISSQEFVPLNTATNRSILLVLEQINNKNPVPDGSA